MSDKKLTKALNAMQALDKEQMKLFLFEAKSNYSQRFDDDTEEEEDDIDKLKSDLELAYAEHETTCRMVRKVYFGEAKMVYDVYADDAINFEDNAGEFLW